MPDIQTPDQPLATTTTALDELDVRCQKFLHRAREIRVHHLIAGVLHLGQAGVEHLYGGDPTLVHDRSAAQEAPLRHLLARHGPQLAFLGITVDQVRAAMRAWETNRGLPTDIQGKLSPSHLQALAVVRSVADRSELATLALEHAWSAGQTAAHVSSFRRKHRLVGKGGRPPLPPHVKAAGAVGRALDSLGAPEAADGLDDSVRAELRARLEAVQARVGVWLGRL